MTRLGFAVMLAALLGVATILFVQPDSDVRSVLGADGQIGAGLDTPTGRAMTIAVIGPDRDARTKAAKALIEDLRTDPMTSRVKDPVYTAALMDWIWEHRLILAPPPAEATTTEAMAAELTRAVESFDHFSQAPLAPRYLLDPTGSYRRIVERLADAGPEVPSHQGVLQAKDDSAALVFVTLTAEPFDVAKQSALNQRIHAAMHKANHEAIILGPRPTSAQISTRISQRATVSAGIATAVLLGWLVWLTRSASGLIRILLPVAIGAGTAALVVQAMFGSVHVLALGFGGALMGLAIDYPIHLISHSDRAGHQQRALRWIILGAVTTAIAFLAMFLAGITALTQIGVFVATGLVTAAVCCWWLGVSFASTTLRPPGWHPRSLKLPGGVAVLAGIAILASTLLWFRPADDQPRLITIPTAVKSDIARIGQMLDLPSGRLRLEVTGEDLPGILTAQAKLRPVLSKAQMDGALSRWQMLADLLPFRDAKPPAPADVIANLPAAMASAGLNEAFADQITTAYESGHSTATAPISIPQGLLQQSALGTLLQPAEGRLSGTVQLWGVTDPEGLTQAITALQNPNIRVVDTQKRITTQLKSLTQSVLHSLGLGAIAALIFLAVFRRDAAQIAIATAAATAVTALIVSLVTGTLGIFQIVALVLVTGIGIDYGLFLRNDAGEQAFRVAASSVTRCAITTLIAFVVMACSGVTVLENIGITVSIGVLAMLAAHLIRSPERGRK